MSAAAWEGAQVSLALHRQSHRFERRAVAHALMGFAVIVGNDDLDQLLSSSYSSNSLRSPSGSHSAFSIESGALP